MGVKIPSLKLNGGQYKRFIVNATPPQILVVGFAKGETRFRKKEYAIIAELDPRQKEIYDCLQLGQFVEGGEFEDT